MKRTDPLLAEYQDNLPHYGLLPLLSPEEVERFERWLESLEVVPTIAALRRRGEDVVAQVLRENASARSCRSFGWRPSGANRLSLFPYCRVGSTSGRIFLRLRSCDSHSARSGKFCCSLPPWCVRRV